MTQAYRWTDIPIERNAQEQNQEQILGWPPGTLAVMRAAFARKLSRHRPWDLSYVKDPEPFRYAARYYKRGILSESQLTTQEGSYKFSIASDPSQDFFSLLGKSFVICDSEVYKHWPQIFSHSVDYIFENHGESTKNLEEVCKLLQSAQNASGKDWLIIGGGILCDLAAFAASLKGVAFYLVPTSLLSMVDASVGGKTGVNFAPFGKNQIGSFNFPKAVLIFTSWLHTLPEREFYAGAVEAFKHALLLKNRFFIEELVQTIRRRDLQTLSQQLPTLLKVKADIVYVDPYEQGVRSLLNLGHTVAHALESFSLEQAEPHLNHGEAVAWGLLLETFLAEQQEIPLAFSSQEIFTWLKSSGCLLSQEKLQCFLPLTLSSEECMRNLYSYMLQDKKAQREASIPISLLLKSEQGLNYQVLELLEADFQNIWQLFWKNLHSL